MRYTINNQTKKEAGLLAGLFVARLCAARLWIASLSARLSALWITAGMAIASLFLLALFSFSALAQGGATIRGHVTDERGANVAGAEIHLRGRNGIKLFGRTDREGVYAFTGLGQGEYIVEVAARGFATQSSEVLHTERGRTIDFDVKLLVQSVNENVLVVATGTPQRADEVSKAVTLIGGEEIETRRELTLSEALRGTPGLRVQQLGSYGALTTIRLRGLRRYDTGLLLDGLRVRDAADLNGSAVSFISDLLPTDLDRVEILRGSGSSIYGTNSIGGVINLVPKTGAGSPRFEAGFEGGSLALFRERLRGTGGLGQRAGYSFELARIDVRRGVDGQDEYGNTAGGARFQFNATPGINLSANFYGTISNARINDSPVALAAAFNSGQLYPRAQAGVTFEPDFNNPDEGRRNRLLVGSVRLMQRVNEVFSYTLAYQRVSSQRRNYNGPNIDPRFASFYPFGDFEFVAVNNGTTDTLDARANLRLGSSHLVTAGIEYERESFYQQSIPSFSLIGSTTDRQSTFAVFGQDQMLLLDGRLQLSIGARGQFYSLSAAARPGFLSDLSTKSSITGDGSIAYFIRQTSTKLRAHIGNGFRAPSLFERFGEGTFTGGGLVRFGDPTLKPEQSIGLDAGFDQLLAGERVRLGATYFYTRLQRVIDFAGFAADPLGLGRTRGYLNRSGGGLARGLESYLETKPLRNTEVRASYTFTNSVRVDRVLGLQREFVVPKHLFGLTLSQRYRAFLFNFDLNRTGRYIAPVFESDFPFRQVNLSFGGYTKADAYLSYERPLSERLTVIFFGGAENIFDEDYFENGFRAPGLTGRGGASLRF